MILEVKKERAIEFDRRFFFVVAKTASSTFSVLIAALAWPTYTKHYFHKKPNQQDE